jgi:hypothetical protein
MQHRNNYTEIEHFFSWWIIPIMGVFQDDQQQCENGL